MSYKFVTEAEEKEAKELGINGGSFYILLVSPTTILKDTMLKVIEGMSLEKELVVLRHVSHVAKNTSIVEVCVFSQYQESCVDYNQVGKEKGYAKGFVAVPTTLPMNSPNSVNGEVKLNLCPMHWRLVKEVSNV